VSHADEDELLFEGEGFAAQELVELLLQILLDGRARTQVEGVVARELHLSASGFAAALCAIKISSLISFCSS